MLIYKLAGWGDDLVRVRNHCRRMGDVMAASRVYVGTYEDAVWTVEEDGVTEGGRRIMRRLGEEPAYTRLSRTDEELCDGVLVSLWTLRKQEGGGTLYAWALFLGYAWHVGPRKYLLTVPR